MAMVWVMELMPPLVEEYPAVCSWPTLERMLDMLMMDPLVLRKWGMANLQP